MTMKKEAAARICPVCGAESDRTHRVYWNFYEQTGSRRWSYDRCPACGAAWLERMKRWSPADFTEKVYNDTYHLCDPEYNGVRSSKALPKIMLYLLFAGQDKKVLDYGGGNGSLAELLRQRGVDAYTYDPYGRQDDNALAQKYHAVSAIEVLEHGIRPHDLFERIAGLLAPNGIFIGTTEPIGGNNIEDWFYANPRAGHCLLWTVPALDLAAKQHGLVPVLHSNNWHVYRKS